MDFDLTEEQSMLKEALQRLLRDKYDFDTRNKVLASSEGWSTGMWDQLAEMGLMALPFAEEDGGLGGGMVDQMIVMEELGRALSLEPFFGTIVLGGAALRIACTPEQRAELVPQVAEGSLKLALAHTERHSRFDLHHVETSATRDGEGYKLSGEKSVVLDGDSADKIFVTARTGGSARDRQGIGLYLIDAGSDGVTRRGYANQDGRRSAEIVLENVRAEAVCGDPENALPAVEWIADQGIAALCAESIGVMSVLHETTTEYLKERKQFGVPIGAFQVLQHKAVDMFVSLEQARSITMYAAMMADSDDAVERSRAMAAAKIEIGRGGRVCGENAVQLHGGVGMTMEFAVGHYFKRMTMIDKTLGDTDHHMERLAEMGGLFE
ncbi:MAG: acyl-CoA dehydrogenase family protein [Rhizobiaceae bacterium]